MARHRVVLGAAMLACFCSASSAQHQPKGIPARSGPAEYTAQTTVSGVTYAASLIPPNEVKHLFAFDISKHYIVFEVAVYPATSSSIDLDREEFIARSSPSGDEVRCTDSITAASVIQQSKLPAPQSRAGNVTTSATVGYETGTDPYTGQRYHGTYTATEVSVDNRDPGPPLPPSPGGYPQDRDLLESQLWAKSLPGGQIRQPVAGYLYFPISALKKKASGTYLLEYAGSSQTPVLNGSASSEAIQLQIPAKGR